MALDMTGSNTRSRGPQRLENDAARIHKVAHIRWIKLRVRGLLFIAVTRYKV